MSSSEGPSSSTQPLASEVEENHTIGPVDPDTEEEEPSISEERCETHSEKESECLSVCCKDISRPCQPANKIILSSLAKNGRNFME